MAGFSPDWLALREPADHRARNAGLAAQVTAFLAGRDPVRIVDLGCGTGSNLRALAPHLGPRQHWTLVDVDAALLEAARGALDAWRTTAPGIDLTIEFARADLNAELDRVLAPGADLVTAAALFDL